MIWKFDNSNTFLLGSFHALKAASNCYSDQIDYIYSKSDHIIFEANLDKIPLSLLTYNDSRKLSDNIPQKLFLKTKQKWLKCGFCESELEKTKPWQVAGRLMMRLLEKRGFSFEYGIDKQLFLRAKSDNKNIIFLEPENLSLICLDNAPPNEQIAYLSAMIDNPDASINMFYKMFKAWSNSNIDLLVSILQENLKLFPSLFQCLVINRNKAWIRTISTSIKTGTPTFIVVGALHCVDVCSIQSLIREIHGYTSTIIKNNVNN